jgi:purine-binding chemotaxis protein CheW
MESNPTSSSESAVRNKNTSQFVGFRLADQEYAFRIEQIQEIVILRQVTRMPQVPNYVEGVSNLRGTIIPIINLRCLFGLDALPADEDTRTIVVNVGERTMGCTVDAVTQVIRIPAERIQPTPDVITTDSTAYITGFAKLDDRILVILNIDELLEPEKLDQVRQAAPHLNTMPQL